MDEGGSSARLDLTRPGAVEEKTWSREVSSPIPPPPSLHGDLQLHHGTPASGLRGAFRVE